jgi:hypothetical protein
MICAPTLNAVGAASALRPTDCSGQGLPLSPAEGWPIECDSLLEAAALRGGENIDLAC